MNKIKFYKHIVEAMMKALEENLELEILIPRMMNGNTPLKSRFKVMNAILYVIWVLVYTRFQNLYVMC